MADNQNLCDGFGNAVVFNETGMTIEAAPGQDINLVTSNGGEVLENGVPVGGGGVLSFNGRTGAVMPATGDYSVSQITGLNFVDAEIPTTFTTNNSYTLAHAPNPASSLQVFIQNTSTVGLDLLLIQGIDYTLTVGGTRITYTAPIVTNEIRCWYRF